MRNVIFIDQAEKGPRNKSDEGFESTSSLRSGLQVRKFCLSFQASSGVNY